MGQKSQSDRAAPRVNRTWDSRWFADDAGLRPACLLEDLKIREFVHQGTAKQAGVAQRRHRASAQEVPRHDLCRPSGRHHRQEGRRHREAAQEARRDDGLRTAPEHR